VSRLPPELVRLASPTATSEHFARKRKIECDRCREAQEPTGFGNSLHVESVKLLTDRECLHLACAMRHSLNSSLKLEINKWNLAGNGKKLERQKYTYVGWDLDASGDERQPVNKLIALLGNRQKQRNEKERDGAGRE
jgi:hypothetical protein